MILFINDSSADCCFFPTYLVSEMSKSLLQMQELLYRAQQSACFV